MSELPYTPIIVTPTLAVATYTADRCLFNPIALTRSPVDNGNFGRLMSLMIIDEDNQGAAMDLLLLRSNTPLASGPNVALSISKANLRPPNLRRIIRVAAANYVQLGPNVKGYDVTHDGNGFPVEAAVGSEAIYLAAITRGTPTHTASGIVIATEWLR